MIFTFLESVLQDGEFEYFWRSVRPLELKLCELKKESIFDDFNFFFFIFKVIRTFERRVAQTSKSTQIIRLDAQIPNM